jgi:riboflavin biosynthesis pyrimidine reductase
VVLYVAGRLLGGRGALPAFGGAGAGRLRQAPRLLGLSVRPMGPDLMIEGRPRFPGGARRVGR